MNIDRQRIAAVKQLTELGYRFDGNQWCSPISSDDKLKACVTYLASLRALCLAAGCSAGPKYIVMASIEDLHKLGTSFGPSVHHLVTDHYSAGRAVPDIKMCGARFVGPSS